MRESLTRPIGRLRNPEYTGENRCIPCTAVNVAIAAVAAVAVAVALTTPVGLAVLVVSLAAVYLRGYLVPGTPTLTGRYLPDSVLARFDKGPRAAGGPVTGGGAATDAAVAGDDAASARGDEPGATDDGSSGNDAEDGSSGSDAGDAPAEGDLDPERLLLDAGAVEPCAEVDDLCLAASFAEDWLAACRRLRDEDERAAEIADLYGGSAASLQFTGTWHRAIVDGERRGKWPSEAAAVADLAADSVLRDRHPDWTDLSPDQRTVALVGLRSFAETCPLCDGPVTAAEETQQSCCRSWDVFRVACDECDEALLELDPETYRPLA